MEVESSICLSDLVPALRWSRPQQVAEVLGDPRLPAGWWSSLALSRALGTAGLDWICDRLARLASSRWDHLPLCDLLPALTVHHVDPALPGWPDSTRTAVTGLGGWHRLRRLSPADLTTPSATPEVLMGAVFREIIGRIPAQREAAQAPGVSPLPGAASPLAGAPGSASPLSATPGSGSQPSGTPGSTSPLSGTSASGAPLPGAPAAAAGAPASASQLPGPSASPPSGAPASGAPASGASQPGAPGSQPPASPETPGRPGHPEVTRPVQRDGEGSPRGTGPFPAAPDGLPQRPAAAQSGWFPAQGESGPQPTGDGLPQRPAFPQDGTASRPGSFQPARDPRQNGSLPSPQEGRQTGSFPAVEGQRPSNSFTPADDQRQPGSFTPPDNQRQTGSFPAAQDPRQTGSFPAAQAEGGGSGQRQTGSFPAQSGSVPAQQQGGGPRQGFPGEGLPQRPGTGQSGPGAGPSERLPQRPTGPQPGRPSAGPSGPGQGSGGPSTGSIPRIPSGDTAKGVPAYAGPSAVPSDPDHAMVRVVDGLFRTLDKLELAVAVHRLFAEDPISLRTLAHKMLVDRDALSQAQRTAEERVLHWLRSSESAPVTGHMFRLTEWLGAAATEDQLIGADPAHPVMVPSLRTPLWRVLVTLMPDRRLQDGWLVVGDIHGLQARTRQLLASAPPDADVVALMAELGIRAHSAKAWLDALPPEAAPDRSAAQSSPAQPLPRRTPGANGHHHRGGQPIPPAPAGSIDPSAALATLSALSGGRSAILHVAGTPSTPPPPLPSPSSDPRRWQRIEVTPEHLRGGPVPVPEGYAAQLGMRPGTLLSVTGPGDNAIVLVWQGQQPVFDSLQPVLMRLNARPGDQVYVTVDGYRLEAQLTG
ncbi:hypothetical protein ACIBP6_25770 [Nonomuraea terrae]|uniref:hypothetical protein n=1 Tax=Nonomuraea terrae TaxID=2530383 RepID=UPI00378994B6